MSLRKAAFEVYGKLTPSFTGAGPRTEYRRCARAYPSIRFRFADAALGTCTRKRPRIGDVWMHEQSFHSPPCPDFRGDFSQSLPQRAAR